LFQEFCRKLRLNIAGIVKDSITSCRLHVQLKIGTCCRTRKSRGRKENLQWDAIATSISSRLSRHTLTMRHCMTLTTCPHSRISRSSNPCQLCNTICSFRRFCRSMHSITPPISSELLILYNQPIIILTGSLNPYNRFPSTMSICIRTGSHPHFPICPFNPILKTTSFISSNSSSITNSANTSQPHIQGYK
jgi:hypothetical protein